MKKYGCNVRYTGFLKIIYDESSTINGLFALGCIKEWYESSIWATSIINSISTQSNRLKRLQLPLQHTSYARMINSSRWTFTNETNHASCNTTCSLLHSALCWWKQRIRSRVVSHATCKYLHSLLQQYGLTSFLLLLDEITHQLILFQPVQSYQKLSLTMMTASKDIHVLHGDTLL